MSMSKLDYAAVVNDPATEIKFIESQYMVKLTQIQTQHRKERQSRVLIDTAVLTIGTVALLGLVAWLSNK